jgi:hypothetical protein
MEKKQKEMYYLLHDLLVNEPKIVSKVTRKNYNMELEIENCFLRGERFKSIIMASNMIEAFLRRIYHRYSTLKKGGPLLIQEADENNKINFVNILKWANGTKIKGKKYTPLPPRENIVKDNEFKKLITLKNIRNDFAHIYYLNFDENIDKEYAEEILRLVQPILTNLITHYKHLVDSNKSTQPSRS